MVYHLAFAQCDCQIFLFTSSPGTLTAFLTDDFPRGIGRPPSRSPVTASTWTPPLLTASTETPLLNALTVSRLAAKRHRDGEPIAFRSATAQHVHVTAAGGMCAPAAAVNRRVATVAPATGSRSVKRRGAPRARATCENWRANRSETLSFLHSYALPYKREM